MIRAIGKSKAMEMVLTGNMIDAHQAERDGMCLLCSMNVVIVLNHTVEFSGNKLHYP